MLRSSRSAACSDRGLSSRYLGNLADQFGLKEAPSQRLDHIERFCNPADESKGCSPVLFRFVPILFPVQHPGRAMNPPGG
jgi:hypothetical protein